MKRSSVLKIALLGAGLFVAHGVAATDKVSLQALFKDKAIVLVDGTRRVLQVGQDSPEGLKLLATDTAAETAEIEVNGKRQTLNLGVVVSSFAPRGKGSATLYPAGNGHFFTAGLINGRPVQFMVDTGATVIAMNSGVAQSLGVDYRRNGHRSVASTPGGYVRTYDIKLDSVQVGDITLYNVDASVIEGNDPQVVLLGMSFLGQLDMKRDDEKMELNER
ncbi:MAG TPA: TIGR02281 family clan AA aspartic protease [Candidatus Methylomirabilis sp.]|nr:TIGR02281 family clan AA aspartic protease [Candidatus Methylomirabilis sp.]